MLPARGGHKGRAVTDRLVYNVASNAQANPSLSALCQVLTFYNTERTLWFTVAPGKSVSIFGTYIFNLNVNKLLTCAGLFYKNGSV